MINNLGLELLLNKISQLYKTNSNTNYNDIYNYISKNNKKINLINIQSNFYQNKKEYEQKGIKIIPYQDYLGIYLPGKDKKVPSALEKKNNIKIYISLDKESIYEVSIKIIEYMSKKSVPALYTIQNYYNNKVISISFINIEDLQVVFDYLNKEIKLNNKISIGIDGIISYDTVLSKIIERYMKEIDSYDNVNTNNFANFIEENIIALSKNKKEYLMLLYDIDSNEKYQDFNLLSNLIKYSIYKEITLEKLEKCQKKLCTRREQIITANEKNNIYKLAVREMLDIILEIYDNSPNIKNNIEEMHNNILKFLKEENYNYLPKEYSIRNIIKEKISYIHFKNIIIKLGKETLFKVCTDTKIKYGDEQLRRALLEAENTGNICSFTNVSGNRSELGLVMPKELLKEIIKKEYNEFLLCHE